MELLKKSSFEKREKIVLKEMKFDKNVKVSTYFDNKLLMVGICNNCLNNNNCVWMENKKIECEEHN